MGTDHLGEDRQDLVVEAGHVIVGERAEPLEQGPRQGEAESLQVLVHGGDDGGGALVAALVEQDPTPLGQVDFWGGQLPFSGHGHTLGIETGSPGDDPWSVEGDLAHQEAHREATG